MFGLAIPVLWPVFPPLTDLPGHIGRYFIVFDIRSSAYLQKYFAIDWRLIPNLGVDLIVWSLAPLMGIEPAAKFAVMLIPVITGAGFLLIAREYHGRVPVTAIFALPLAYHYAFQFGFVNYSLSMALAMLALGLWERLGRLKRKRLRAALFVFIAPAIWLCHIYGWGVLGLLVFTSGATARVIDGDRWWRAVWHSALACLPLTIPVVLVVLWRDGGTGGIFGWFDWLTSIKWLVTVLRDRWQLFDLASGIIVYVLAFAPFVLRRWLHVDVRLAVPAFVLWVFALLLPNYISGSAFAGVRLIPFALALSILAIKPAPAMPERAKRLIGMAGLIFFAARMTAHTISYWIADARNRGNLAALQKVERGARVVALVGQRCGDWATPRHLHLSELATSRREAFVNGHWEIPGGQVLRIKYRAGAPFVADGSQFVNVTNCDDRIGRIGTAIPRIPMNAFDYLWIIEVPSIEWPKDPQLRPVWTNGHSVLYRISPSGRAAGVAGNAR